MIKTWNPRHVQQELALCQRYYCKTFSIDSAPVQAFGTISAGVLQAIASATTIIQNFIFPVEMRAAPTITTYNPTQFNADWRENANTADIAVFTGAISTRQCRIGSTGATDTRAYQIHVSAESEL